MRKVDLQKFMWEIMKHLGPGNLSRRENGEVVYSVSCSCGDTGCGDEAVLYEDCIIWTRGWGSMTYWDRWLFTEDGSVEYIGTVSDESFRHPPLMP